MSNIKVKKIKIDALTKTGRLEQFENEKSNRLANGWEFLEYKEDGISKSYATFKIDMNSDNGTKYKNSDMYKKDKMSTTISIIFKIGIALFIVYIFVSISSNTSDKNILQDNLTITLKELKNKPKGTIKDVAIEFAKVNKIDESYYSTMYDCLSYNTYSKNQELKVNTVIGWCKDDYINKDKKAIYYNKEWLIEEFSSWDGSYRPLEELIKNQMNDSSSYEHIETTYRMVLFGTKRPYMFVRTKFKGKNAFGGIVQQTIEVKVDAKTKELFEMK